MVELCASRQETVQFANQPINWSVDDCDVKVIQEFIAQQSVPPFFSPVMITTAMDNAMEDLQKLYDEICRTSPSERELTQMPALQRLLQLSEKNGCSSTAGLTKSAKSIYFIVLPLSVLLFYLVAISFPNATVAAIHRLGYGEKEADSSNCLLRAPAKFTEWFRPPVNCSGELSLHSEAVYFTLNWICFNILSSTSNFSSHQVSYSSIDWLVDCLLARLIDRLIDWLIARLIGCSIDWLIDWLIHWLRMSLLVLFQSAGTSNVSISSMTSPWRTLQRNMPTQAECWSFAEHCGTGLLLKCSAITSCRTSTWTSSPAPWTSSKSTANFSSIKRNLRLSGMFSPCRRSVSRRPGEFRRKFSSFFHLRRHFYDSRRNSRVSNFEKL